MSSIADKPISLKSEDLLKLEKYTPLHSHLILIKKKLKYFFSIRVL